MIPPLAEIVWDSGTAMMTLIFALPIVSIVAGVWYKAQKVTSENALKRSMVERGMSADDIERVLKSTNNAKDE